eukprot:SAG11_NODE_1413_length_4981_cov_2.208726_7_plen_56_part_00
MTLMAMLIGVIAGSRAEVLCLFRRECALRVRVAKVRGCAGRVAAAERLPMPRSTP